VLQQEALPDLVTRAGLPSSTSTLDRFVHHRVELPDLAHAGRVRSREVLPQTLAKLLIAPQLGIIAGTRARLRDDGGDFTVKLRARLLHVLFLATNGAAIATHTVTTRPGMPKTAVAIPPKKQIAKGTSTGFTD
jgi:hypothetical protein